MITLRSSDFQICFTRLKDLENFQLTTEFHGEGIPVLEIKGTMEKI